MPQSRASGPTTTDTTYCVYLSFTGFGSQSPEKILLCQQRTLWDSDLGLYVQRIEMPALPKPNISGFKGWTIKSLNSTSEYWVTPNSDEIFTKGQTLFVYHNDSENYYDLYLQATPVIETGVSIGVAWGEF